MKITILGSGWLAQPLAAQLQTDGHETIMTTTQSNKVTELKAKGLNVKQYELGDQLSDPSQLFNTDVLIIAITSKDIEAYDVLMDQLTEQPCKHLLFISSTSVYQNDDSLHDENSKQLNLTNPLLAIEKLIQQHPSATTIRFAGLVGPGRHPGRFFAQGRTLKNPTAPVNLIHLDDCIGIIKAVIEKRAWKQIFNACASTHPQKFKFYQQAAQQYGAPEPVTEDTESGSYKTIDSKKVDAILNYDFIYSDVMTMSF
jgi:nucleoside-diphosphate-sugar epimerase